MKNQIEKIFYKNLIINILYFYGCILFLDDFYVFLPSKQ